ncbi:hypothetical protein LCGC14_1312070 [marine sediment metagenome]|uniref:Uncharacterized protein n=1 Tax=marine sediment metagenome TaxID=412755 RepID=A0A0F9NPH8_9ZZZZ
MTEATTRRLFYWTFLAFSLLTFTLPIRRPIMDSELEGLSYLLKTMPYAAIGAMIMIYYLTRYPKVIVFVWTDILTATRVWNPIVLIIMPVFLVMFIAQVPGGWWTWSTLALHISTVILLANILRSHLRPTVAFLIAGSIVTLGAGSWELLYQVSMFVIYYEPQGASSEGLIFVIAFLSPMIFGGLAVMLQTSFRSVSYPPYLNKLSLAFFGLTIMGVIGWYLSGFWVDVLYDVETSELFHQEGLNYWSMLSYKVSKVTLGLGLIFLYLPRKVNNAQQI